MSEVLKIVKYDVWDQLVALFDLEERNVVYKVAGSVTVTPGGRTPSMATADSRRGGSVQVAERRENGTFAARWGVKGNNADECMSRLEAFLARTDDAEGRPYIYWQMDGATYPQMYPIRGTATATTLDYKWAPFQEGLMFVEISWPIAPLAEEPVLDFSEDFSVRQLDDSDDYVNWVSDARMRISSQWSISVSGSGVDWGPEVENGRDVGSFSATTLNASGTLSAAHPARLPNVVRADRAIGFRARMKLHTGPSGNTGTLLLRLRGLNSQGSQTALVDVATQVSPVVGTYYDLVGTYTGATHDWYSIQLAYTNGTTAGAAEVRVEYMMLVPLPSATTTVPDFFDDLTEWGRAEKELADQYFGRGIGIQFSRRLAESKMGEYKLGTPKPFYSVVKTPSTATSTSGQGLSYNAGLTTAQALTVHTGRRPWAHGVVTAGGYAGASAASSELAVTPGLGYDLSSGRYFWAGLEAGNLRLYEFNGVSHVMRAQVAQVAPAVGTIYFIRVWRDATTVRAEYHTSRPTLNSGPVTSVSYNITVIPPFSLRDALGHPVLQGSAPTAGAGNWWTITHFESLPFSYRNLNLPATISLPQLPGTAPAAVDIDTQPIATDTDFPRHCLIGWRSAKPGSGVTITGQTVHRSMLIDGDGALTPLPSGTSLVVDATRYRGSSSRALGITTTATDGSAGGFWYFDPSAFDADDFYNVTTLGVFVRYWRDTGIVNPRLRAALQTPADPFVTGRPAPEFGTTGRYLPTQGSGVRTTYLGTLRPEAVGVAAGVIVMLFWSAGSATGVRFAIDELYLVPLGSLASGATGKSRDDGTYTAYMSDNQRVRRVYSNLSGAYQISGFPPSPYPVNMGGANIEFPPSYDGIELLVRPSVGVPDDPVTTNSDILAHNMSVHARVTPRHHLVAAP